MNATTSKVLARIDGITSDFQIASSRAADETLDLRYGVRPAASGAARRFVVFLNGRTEWLEKYSYVAEDLHLPEDTAFLTWDHRGQGASGGARSFVDDYETYAKDGQRLIAEQVGDRPYTVVSHSMGALIALYATLKGYMKPQALVLCSPLLGLPNDPVPRPLARPLARLFNHCRLGAVSSGAGTFTAIPFEVNQLTHHVELYRRMQNNPFKVPGATFGWVTATFRALDVCFDPQMLADYSVPTLVLGSPDDSVVDATAFKRWVQVASAHAKSEVRLRTFPGAKHELLSEIPEYYEPAVAEVRAALKPFLG